MRRLNPSKRSICVLTVLALTLALLAIAVPSHADTARLLSIDGAATAEGGNLVESEVVPPDRVFVQKTDKFPDHGNVLVIIEVSDQALADKAAEGKDFITLGDDDAQIIARNDGKGGDDVAGDNLFTAIAFVDDEQMVERANEDSAALTEKSENTELVFDGRVEAGEQSVSAFDSEAFLAGRRVELNTAIVTIDGEGGETTTAEPKGTTLNVVGASHTPGTNVFQDRVLFIRDLAVVEDPTRTWNPCDGSGNPNGVWTFNHLMTEMANQPASGIDPSTFVEEWLKTWVQNPGPSINSFTVSTRQQMQVIIDNWRADSGGGKLDLAKSPLRLLAIVPRLDLRRTTGGGGGYGNANVSGNFLDAGEARFVFGFVAPPSWGSGGGTYDQNDDLGFIASVPIKNEPGCTALPFNVILEYRVPKCDCFDVRGWARGWVNLRNFTPGSNAYNSRLERLTETFARRNADPTRPNGSAIGQVRTNEVALPQDAPIPDVVWELREFQLTQMPFSMLAETTTADTPHDSFNANSPQFSSSQLLFDWIAGAGGTGAPVPLFFQGSASAPQNFLGANPQVPEANPFNITYHWNHPMVGPGLNAERFTVSISACSGCHRDDTDTPFVHVDNANAGTGAVLPAPISGFLTGIAVPDPAFGTPTRHFDDLHRRERDIKKVAKMRCFRFHPINVRHVQQSLQSTGALPNDLFGEDPVTPLELRPALSVDDMRRNAITQVH